MVAPSREGHALYEAKPTAASGFLLQITNVKILVLCLTALCSYVLPLSDHPLALAAAGLVMPLIGVGCNLAWIYAGELLRSFYERHRRRVRRDHGGAPARKLRPRGSGREASCVSSFWLRNHGFVTKSHVKRAPGNTDRVFSPGGVLRQGRFRARQVTKPSIPSQNTRNLVQEGSR